jgi:hypothetical protein
MFGRVEAGAISLIVALIGCAALASPIPGSQKDVAGWTIIAFEEEGGKFTGCGARTRYQGGVQMHVGALADGNWQIGWASNDWKFTVGETNDVDLFVDKAGPFPITTSVRTPTMFAVTLPPSSQIFDLVRRGQMLTLARGSARLNITLGGSTVALTELANCHSRYASAAGRPAPQNAPPPQSTVSPGAPQAPSGMPPEVAGAVAELQSNCRQSHKAPPPVGEYVTRVDLTGDGVDCAGFSGSGGSGMQIFVGTADGHAREAVNRYAFGVDIEKGGPGSVVWLTVGGPACGQSANVPRAMSKSCRVPLIWNRAAQRFDEGPLSQAR